MATVVVKSDLCAAIRLGDRAYDASDTQDHKMFMQCVHEYAENPVSFVCGRDCNHAHHESLKAWLVAYASPFAIYPDKYETVDRTRPTTLMTVCTLLYGSDLAALANYAGSVFDMGVKHLRLPAAPVLVMFLRHIAARKPSLLIDNLDNIAFMLRNGCTAISSQGGTLHGHAEYARILALLGSSSGAYTVMELLHQHGQLRHLCHPDGGLYCSLHPRSEQTIELLYEMSRNWVHGRVPTESEQRMDLLDPSPLAKMILDNHDDLATILLRRNAPLRLDHRCRTYRPFATFCTEFLVDHSYYPRSPTELFHAFREGCEFQRVVLSLLLARSHRLESAWSLIPNELLFEILMRVGYDYTEQVDRLLFSFGAERPKPEGGSREKVQ